MKVFGFVLIAVFFVAANAVPGGYVSAYQPAPYNKKGGSYADQNYGATYGKDYYTEPNYQFAYTVEEPYYYGEFGQEEKRQGEYTDGNYFVDQSDGKRRIVDYYVNGNSGFVAKVNYVDTPTYNSKNTYASGPKAPYGSN